jgi:hypothetical protein
MDRTIIRAKYEDLKRENEALFGKKKKLLLWISVLRLLVFAGGIILSAAAFTWTVFAGVLTLLTVLSIFLFLVKRFAEESVKMTFFENLVKINNDELSALSGDYSAFDDGSEWNDTEHDFANDIDLFGKDSLFQYLNRTVTGYGREILAIWLSDPYSLRNGIAERQESVKELVLKLKWRQEFIASGMDRSTEKQDLSGMEEWLKESNLLLSGSVKRFAVFLFPLAAVFSLCLVIAGIIPFEVFIVFFLLNLLFTGLGLRNANRIHSMVSKKYLFLSSFGRLVSSLEDEKFSSRILGEIRKELLEGSGSAARRIKKLSTIVQAFDSRLNVFVGFLLNGILLWDYHCILALEKWKSESVNDIPRWLKLIGEADALISLANHSYNNPKFGFPRVSETGLVFSVEKLGHPLIEEERRVCNDFKIDKNGLIFIITGANMAGKSTFLRTIAVNMILAMAGTTVCAEKMEFMPVRLFTSMRTTDSLSHNESYFYAELKRLKVLKDRLVSGENLFFILDEILKGTNSTDKSTGSKMFLKKIIESGGTGLIATHDISLGEMETVFPDKVLNKCFEIEIDGEKISFDFRLREGITKRMNAAILMRQMGITG